MKYIYLLIVVASVLAFSSVLNAADNLQDQLVTQQTQIETLQAKSEKCAKKASNFAYIIDKKLYSEESAARIYETCLNE